MPAKIILSRYRKAFFIYIRANIQKIRLTLFCPVIFLYGFFIIFFCKNFFIPLPGSYINIKKNFITSLTSQTETCSSNLSPNRRNTCPHTKRNSMSIFKKNKTIFSTNIIHPNTTVQIGTEIYFPFLICLYMHKNHIINCRNPSTAGKMHAFIIFISDYGRGL